jgi:TonB-linked SusC/RagA family outer membrane protein
MLSKYAIIGIVAQFFAYSLLLAEESAAQNVKSVYDVNIHIDKESATIEELLSIIEMRTEYVFAYDKADIHQKQQIMLEHRRHSVSELLMMLSQSQKISFRQINNNIFIKKLQKDSDSKIEVYMQAQTVTGLVTSAEDGDGLPGVNVIVKGTSQGTVTDLDGRYNLEVPGQEAILVFSSVGFVQEEVLVGNQAVIDLSLMPDLTQLDELVVIGYGTQKKSDLTGSVSSLSMEEFSSVPVGSVDQMMQGRAAGVQVTSSSGSPGASSSIKIRGVNSINSSSEPLYVIDGVPIAANTSGDISASGTSGNTGNNILSTINPGDIQSIEILKDASSTAIYGSRGANGVIIITTKSGASEKSTINFNANYGVSTIPGGYDLLSADDFFVYFNEFAALEGLTPIDPALPMEDNDWFDIASQNGVVQNYQLSLTGGSKKTNYYISGSYYDEEGVVKESYLRRYTGRINAEHSPTDRVRIGVNFNYSHNETGMDEGNQIRTVQDALALAPNIPQTDPSGPVYYPSFEYIGNGQIFAFNPLGYIYGNDYENFNDRLLLSANAAIDITPSLSFKSTFGVDLIYSMDQFYTTKLHAPGQNTNGRAQVEQRRTFSLTNSNQLIYQKTAGKHSFNGTLIHEVTKASTQNTRNNWDNFPTDALSFYGIQTGTIAANIGNQLREWAMLSFATRLNYTYDSRYLFTFTARQDGSSRFGTDNKWGFFPSGAVAWRLSEESFMQQSEIISDLKLRGSYGLTGNTDIGFYNSIVTIGTRQYSSVGTEITAYTPQRIANEDLRWETTKQLNIGFDLGMWNNRLTLNADYFNSVTNDLLLAVNIPENSGFSSVLKNAGSVKNDGIELTLNAVAVSNEKFNWNIMGTFSRSVNKVTDLGGENQIGVGGQTLIVGQPLRNHLGVIQTGIFQTEEEILTNPARPNDEPGVPRYRDVNEDGRIDGNDNLVLGRGFPDFFYGLTSTFTYGNFDLFVYFSGVEGLTVLNATKRDLTTGRGQNIIQEYFDNRWTEDNPSDTYPRIDPLHAPNSDLYLEDASFLRLKVLTLGYNIPVNQNWLSNARVYVSGQNLFTITGYSGFDPEVNSNGQNNVAPPTDNGAYPRARNISVGVNLTF